MPSARRCAVVQAPVGDLRRRDRDRENRCIASVVERWCYDLGSVEMMAPGQSVTALRVDDLKVSFRSQRGIARAVRGVSFHVNSGETLGLVGESGSGKSVTALTVIGMVRDSLNARVEGSVKLGDEELLGRSDADFRAIRRTRMSMVVQDPLSSLNPAYTIGNQVMESLSLAGVRRRAEARSGAVDLLESMRIPGAKDRLKSYPHEFSGGMRQRTVSAMALAGSPEVLIADEPTTALDVTMEAAYLDVLKSVISERRLGVLFITHDLGVVSRMCDRVAVMYAGRIVELGDVEQILFEPGHPYTRALLRAVPSISGSSRIVGVPGSPSSPYSTVAGCPFADRCWLYEALGRPQRCVEEAPPLATDVGHVGADADDGEHLSACHFHDECRQWPDDEL